MDKKSGMEKVLEDTVVWARINAARAADDGKMQASIHHCNWEESITWLGGLAG